MRFLAGVPLAAMLPLCALVLGACGSTSHRSPAMAPAIQSGAGASNAAAENPSSTQLYIVQLHDAPVTTYAGGVPGLAPTNPGVTGEHSLDLNSAASRAYTAYLKAQQERFLAAMDTVLGRTVTPTFVYFYAMNGMSLRLTPTEAARVAKLPGVVSVRKDMARTPLDSSPQSRPPR